MKKYFAAACLIMVWRIPSLAQIDWGVKAGINGSNQTAKFEGTRSTGTTRFGFDAGLFADFKISELFSLQPELGYASMGSRQKGMPVDNVDLTLVANYLHLPVLAKFHFKDFALYAGPEAGLLLSAKTRVSGAGDQDVKDIFNNLDFLGVTGVEYHFNPGIILSARYMFGLSNNIKEASAGTATNAAFQFSAAYLLFTKTSHQK